jgi:ketosteroid isomerase-like protein
MHLNNMHQVTTPALCLALLACQVVPAERNDSVSVSGESYPQQLEQTLAAGAAAWNRGDSDAFMSDYHTDSARTTFVGSRGLLHGRAAIREAYAPRFAEAAARDSSGAWKIVHDHSS